MVKLKDLYEKQIKIEQTRALLKTLEDQFDIMCKELVDRGIREEKDLILVEKERKIRRIPDVKGFMKEAGEMGWSCLSVSISKVDTLNIQLPSNLVETHITKTYKVVKK